MADTIHKKKKDWPHFNKLHLGSQAYADGWDRIFGKKEGKDEIGEQVQEAGEKVARKRRAKSKGASRVYRAKKVRQG